MWLSSFQTWLSGARKSTLRGWRPKPTCRPGLEVLEDRTVPSTFKVTNLNDAGPGSLRQAVLDANADAAPDKIVFKTNLAGKTINLSTIDPTHSFGPNALEITTPVMVVGTNQKIVRSGPLSFRLFYVSPTGRLTLKNLTLQNGLAKGGNGGIGALNDGGGGGGG